MTMNVIQYVNSALSEPLPPPPRDPASYKGSSRGNGVWGMMNAEQRSQYARELVACRTTKGGGRPVGVPHGWTKEAMGKAKVIVAKEVEDIISRLLFDGKLDESDARDCGKVRQWLTIARMPGQARRRQAAAKRLLKRFGEGVEGLLV